MNRIVVVLLLATSACDTSVQAGSCSPQTCTGCCTSTGQCQSGSEATACGTSGSRCTDCSQTGQLCTFGQCLVTGGTGGGSTSVGGGSMSAGGTAGGFASAGGTAGGTNRAGGSGGGTAIDAGQTCGPSNCLGCCIGNTCQAVTGQLCGVAGGQCQVCSGTCQLTTDGGSTAASCIGAVDGGRPVTDGGVDTTPPRLIALSFSPSTVDTSAGSQRVVMRIEVVDDLSGPMDYANYSIRAPSSGTSTSTRAVSLSGLTAVYEDTIELPQHWPMGETTFSFSLRDLAQNSASWTTTDLARAGFPTGFLQTGAGDTRAPMLTSVSITPATVNTSMAGHVVTVTATLNDDLAGLGTSMGFSVTAPGGGLSSSLTRSMSGGLSGTFTGTYDLDRYSPQGTYTVSLSARDLAWNSASWTTAQLTSLGFPSSFEQLGPGDSTAPRLVSFAVSPQVVSTASADATVTITAVVVDDLSGLDSYLNYSERRPNGGVSTSMQRVSMNGLTSTYEDRITVPRFSPLGRTSFSLSLRDLAGNSRSMSAEQIADAGFPNSFVNQ